MKVAFISNIYKEENKKEIERLKKEIASLKIRDYKIYIADSIYDNRGYAYGINQGIKQAFKDKAELLVIMNYDISISNLLFEDLLLSYKYFDVWSGAMKQDNKIYYGGEVDKWRLSGGLLLKKPKLRYVETDFITGSLMLVKKEVIDKIGVFDESYFLYYEDVDFCMRARRADFKVGIDSGLIYTHYEFSKKDNPKKGYYLTRNRLKFFLKYSNWKQKVYEIARIPKTFFELLCK